MFTRTVKLSSSTAAAPLLPAAATLCMAIVRSETNRSAVHADSKKQPPQLTKITFLRVRLMPRTCSFRLNAWWRVRLPRRQLLLCCCLFPAAAAGDGPPTSSSFNADGVVDVTPVDTCLGLKNMAGARECRSPSGSKGYRD